MIRVAGIKPRFSRVIIQKTLKNPRLRTRAPQMRSGTSPFAVESRHGNRNGNEGSLLKENINPLKKE